MSVHSSTLIEAAGFAGVRNAADAGRDGSDSRPRMLGYRAHAVVFNGTRADDTIDGDGGERDAPVADRCERDAPVADRCERVLIQLARTAAPRGFRIARDLLGDRDEAEDAVQEALARACEHSTRIRDTSAVKAWFYRVLTNHCMRILRRRRLRRVILGSGRVQRDHARDQPPTAEGRLAHSQAVAQLVSALDTLPAKQRAALLLRYGHELPVAEIADMLGVRPATVKTHLVRGLRRLRKTMEQIP